MSSQATSLRLQFLVYLPYLLRSQDVFVDYIFEQGCFVDCFHGHVVAQDLLVMIELGLQFVFHAFETALTSSILPLQIEFQIKEMLS